MPAYVLDLRHIGGFANFGPDAVWTDVSEMMKEKPMFAGIDAVGEEYLLYSISNPSEADKRGGKYLYSKNTRTNYKINTAVEDWNAMGFFKSLLGIKAADDGNTFIGSVPVSFILMCLDNDMRSSYEPLRNLTEESNPVLVFYTLRPGL